MNPHLSIIICTYNRERYLPKVLDHIREQNLKSEHFEILVINNSSTDNTENICLDFKKKQPQLNFKYFIEKQPGLSYARNKGIHQAKGDVIIFLDDDALPEPFYLREVDNFFRKNKEVIAGGGKIIPEYERSEPRWMTSYLLPVVSALDLGGVVKAFPKRKYPIGANMFFRKEFFDKYGLFKTELGRKGKALLGGEEKDIFERIKNKKEKIIYLPSATVRHIVPAERLNLSYIDNLATGVGISESIRMPDFTSRFRMIFSELYKWAGSIILFLLFFFKFEYKKGAMLLRFRFFVTKGMFIGIRYDNKNSANS